MPGYSKTILDESHKRYIYSCAAAFIVRPTEVARRLGMQKYGDEFGFEPVKIGKGRVRQLLLEIPQRTLDNLRRSYLADFSRTPLAHKKCRIEELTRLYHQVDSLTQLRVGYAKDPADKTGKARISSVSEVVKLDRKLAILKMIRDEVGEDVGRLADALRDSKATLNVNLSSAFINEIVYALQEQVPAKGNGNGSGLPVLDPANEVQQPS